MQNLWLFFAAMRAKSAFMRDFFIASGAYFEIVNQGFDQQPRKHDHKADSKYVRAGGKVIISVKNHDSDN
ncbi:MAG TPA: hypothetical protein IAC39_07515 [Candidatus Faeciplasma pullistercoris]|uniref:Uncharacterized protein n=1 Tax=Candidatus Faeciplasma pullistercoris TaxID=2840800 RepID=A0A9D1GUX9_9FIRM|nr:hypothetical protein [Candidatus Faeciplasma pullistercoris]